MESEVTPQWRDQGHPVAAVIFLAGGKVDWRVTNQMLPASARVVGILQESGLQLFSGWRPVTSDEYEILDMAKAEMVCFYG